MLSKEEAEAFMEGYKEMNQKVAEEFFGESELFDLSRKDLPKWEKDNPHMADDMIRFVGACCIQLINENKELRKEIKDLKSKMQHPFRTIKKKLISK